MAAPLLVLVIVLPPVLLLLGIGIGVAGARGWAARGSAAGPNQQEQLAGGGDIEACTALASAVPSTAGATASLLLPPGRKASSKQLFGFGSSGRGIHIVASSTFLGPPSRSAPSSEAGPPLCLRLTSASTSPTPGGGNGGGGSRAGRLRPPALQTPDPTQPDSPGIGNGVTAAAAAPVAAWGLQDALRGGGGSNSAFGPLAHRKTLSMDLSQLVRAGPSVIGQVHPLTSLNALPRALSNANACCLCRSGCPALPVQLSTHSTRFCPPLAPFHGSHAAPVSHPVGCRCLPATFR